MAWFLAKLSWVGWSKLKRPQPFAKSHLLVPLRINIHQSIFVGKFDNPQRYRDIIRSREKWILGFFSRVYCVVLGRSCLLMLYIFYWFGWSNLFHCISRLMVLLLHDICDFTIVTSQRYIALQQYTLGVSYKPVSKPGNNTLRTCTYSLQSCRIF